MRVELIRHGETLWQGTGRYQGQTDVPLSEQGRQALSPASFSPEKVYITALQRTRQTAERLFPQARLVVVEDLGEMNFGRFEGRSAAEMEAFAIPSRPYFSWGLPCGQGYVLEAEGWLEHRQLRLLGKRDYTKGG